VCAEINASDSTSGYRAHDVGIDCASASAEEAAVHVVPDDNDRIASDDGV
jgi:Family of unknown function (DUF5709)